MKFKLICKSLTDIEIALDGQKVQGVTNIRLDMGPNGIPHLLMGFEVFEAEIELQDVKLKANITNDVPPVLKQLLIPVIEKYYNKDLSKLTEDGKCPKCGSIDIDTDEYSNVDSQLLGEMYTFCRDCGWDGLNEDC